jgi:hypothetical protein
MKMQIFATWDKVKPDTENIGGLNLAAVRLTAVQMTKLPLYHELRKRRHELGLIEALCTQCIHLLGIH